MPPSRKSVVLFSALLGLALLATGCGKFGSSSKSSSNTTEVTAGQIGGNLGTVTTRKVTAVTTAPPTTRPAPKAPTCKRGDATSEVAYDIGIKITFTVSDTCLAKKADLGFSMTVLNTSSKPLHYDVNQIQFFAVKHPEQENKPEWRDTDCMVPPKDRNKLAATLQPGQSLTFTSTYPAPTSVGDREKCRNLEGGPYDAHALFLLCEGEAYTDGYCDISKDTQIKAQPIRVTWAS